MVKDKCNSVEANTKPKVRLAPTYIPPKVKHQTWLIRQILDFSNSDNDSRGNIGSSNATVRGQIIGKLAKMVVHELIKRKKPLGLSR